MLYGIFLTILTIYLFYSYSAEYYNTLFLFG